VEWNKELGPRLIEDLGEDNEHKQRKRYEGIGGKRRYIFECMAGVDGVERYMVEEVFWSRRT